ncbi:MAG: hypothetical protein ACI9JM_001789 [Halioglobus sp.]
MADHFNAADTSLLLMLKFFCQRRSFAFQMAARFSICIGIALCASVLSAQTEIAEEVDGTRFQRTVVYIKKASIELQADFAATALAVLAAAHAREAALAREEIEADGPNTKLSGWSVAVDHYSSDLLVLRDIVLKSTAEGTAFLLTMVDPMITAVTVDRRTTILVHPRSEQQSAFEQSILVDFCSRHPCEKFSPPGEALEPIPVSTVTVRPNWNFTQEGPVCSHRGIQVHFKRVDNLAGARFTCGQFLQEAMVLSDEIAWQQRHAVPIEWGSLKIHATPGVPGHRVELNSGRDSILVVVPVHFSSEGLLEDMRPWLQQRLDKDLDSEINIEASDYGWE